MEWRQLGWREKAPLDQGEGADKEETRHGWILLNVQYLLAQLDLKSYYRGEICSLGMKESKMLSGLERQSEYHQLCRALSVE